MPSARALFSTDVSAFGHSRKKVVGQGFHDERHLRPGCLRATAAGGNKRDEHGKKRTLVHLCLRANGEQRRRVGSLTDGVRFEYGPVGLLFCSWVDCESSLLPSE